MTKFQFELETAGYGKGNLVCKGIHSECGTIVNGICFEFGNEGVWVVSFADFEKLYRMIKAERSVNE